MPVGKIEPTGYASFPIPKPHDNNRPKLINNLDPKVITNGVRQRYMIPKKNSRKNQHVFRF